MDVMFVITLTAWSRIAQCGSGSGYILGLHFLNLFLSNEIIQLKPVLVWLKKC
jgi:hypothetical protein